GIIVTQVLRGSPAEKAGIEPYDVIVEIDGMPIHSRDDLDVAINDGVVGQHLQIIVERDGKRLTKSLVLERRPR
ncbi:MAG: PDZ domain-containing protein, partial [Chlorobiota bacterium]